MSVDINKYVHCVTSMVDKNTQILELIKQKGVIRPRDVEAIGISRMYLHRLYQRGIVERVADGLYALPDTHIHQHTSKIEVAKRVPNGVISLLSALQFHELTTQRPFEVWITIEGTSRKPKIDYPPIHVTRFSGVAFTHGIEVYDIGGVSMRVYSIAKTLADCFKFRNTIGLDVALEAMRDIFRHKRATMSDIWKAAKVCRMTNVMRPYLEAMP